MCKFSKIKVSVAKKRVRTRTNTETWYWFRLQKLTLWSDIWMILSLFFKVQLFSVTLNFTTQTVLLNGSSYNIYILWGMAAAVCLCGPCFDLIVVAFLTTRGPCDPRRICYIHGPDMSPRPRLFTLYCIYIGKGSFFKKKCAKAIWL